jgi:hypothetical protein
VQLTLVADLGLLVRPSSLMIEEVKLVEMQQVWVREPEEEVVEEDGPLCQSMAMVGQVIASLAPLEDGRADWSSPVTPLQ